ncbi:hypothetical protein G3M48_004995 [Beauveria asiatica]|uniref:Uncharacterized protein n=1 Tax=Beauveria asiatica TaxID=1069075 RepID=A0AAW0RS13_9HYPO
MYKAILLRNSIQAHEQLKQQQQPQEMQMTDNTPTTLDQAEHNVGGEGEAEALISWMNDRAQSTPISEGGISTDTEDVDTSSSNENETETETLAARKSESSWSASAKAKRDLKHDQTTIKPTSQKPARAYNYALALAGEAKANLILLQEP